MVSTGLIPLPYSLLVQNSGREDEWYFKNGEDTWPVLGQEDSLSWDFESGDTQGPYLIRAGLSIGCTWGEENELMHQDT